jgi:hypothetical protein
MLRLRQSRSTRRARILRWGKWRCCAPPRLGYAQKQLYQNYLSTLIQNIDAVSNKSAPDGTILDALKLLLASSGYAVTDLIGVDPKTVADAATRFTR